MGNRHKKRGEISDEFYFILFEIVLASIIGLMLLNFINSFKDTTIYDRNYLSRDLALVIDSIYMSPGNIYYKYDYDNKPMSSLDFYFSSTSTTKDNRVSVKDSKKDVKNAYFVSYPYAADKAIVKDLRTLESPDSIFFFKTGDTISNSDMASLNRLKCPKIAIKEKPKKILVDFAYDSEEEEKRLVQLAQTLLNTFYQEGMQIYFTKVIDSGKGLFTESEYQYSDYVSSDIVLRLSLGKGNHVNYFVKSYYLFKNDSFSEGKYLGCSILNSITKSYPEINVANIPAYEEHFGPMPFNRMKPTVQVIELQLGMPQETNIIQPIIGGINEYAR